MSHPRVEEVSESDPEEASDPSEDDIEDFADNDILRRVADPKTSTPAQSNVPSATSTRPQPSGTGGPTRGALSGAQHPGQDDFHTATDAKQYADYHCLYPVYFDASRTRAEGRRVAAHLAVPNPLAREIVNACAALRVPTLFEPGKSHPKDWGNPGRVKVRIPSDAAKGRPAPTATSKDVKNKHHLYLLVAEHLRAHPVKEDSMTLRARIQGVPPAIEPGKPWPRPAVPRGWKIPELVPYISPAMTGGGVSENLFKDIMKEMQDGGDPMSAMMGGQGGGQAALEQKGGKKAKKGKGKA